MRTKMLLTAAVWASLAGAAVISAQVNHAPNPWGPIDNARVHVDLDDAAGARAAEGPTVRISLTDGAVAFNTGRGDQPGGEGAPDPKRRTVIITLKSAKVAPLANTSAYPLAFPRPGVKKVLENDRVVIWDYTWTPGVPTPMHFHDKEVVVVYLAEGALKSTDPNGQSVVNEHYYGFTKFNTRDRVHTEELVKGNARAIIVELK